MVALPTELSRRFLAWLIAGAAALEFLTLMLLSVAHGEALDAAAWGICSVLIFVGVIVVENAKRAEHE